MAEYVVTGCAGFIGSHLTQQLINEGHKVNGIDNLSTGHMENMSEFFDHKSFAFEKADLSQITGWDKMFQNADGVFHQAALGSVPRSVDDPVATFNHNVVSTVNVFEATRNFNIKKIVYASSSSVYGDDKNIIKREHLTGSPLSPYAMSKQMCEQIGYIWYTKYRINSIGLRYFNVYGPRQDANGQYSAVIPKWIKLMEENQKCVINGDPEITRDFTYVKDVVDANMEAMDALQRGDKINGVYNIGKGMGNTLIDLHQYLVKLIQPDEMNYVMADHRNGDIKRSVAQIDKATENFGYDPAFSLWEGLRRWLQSEYSDTVS